MYVVEDVAGRRVAARRQMRSGGPKLQQRRLPYDYVATDNLNSGIFVFGARASLAELAHHEPSILDAAGVGRRRTKLSGDDIYQRSADETR